MMLLVNVFVHEIHVEKPMSVIKQYFLYHREEKDVNNGAVEAVNLPNIRLISKLLWAAIENESNGNSNHSLVHKNNNRCL